MPDASTLLLFAAAAISINLTPGPDMLYVIARSVGQGRRAGVVSSLGLSVGYVLHTLLAASGLAALLASAPGAYGAVRIAGALYLVYLGARALWPRPDRGAPERPVEATAVPVGDDPRWPTVFRQGALTSTLNPSIAVFFLAFLPGFVTPARGSIAGQVIALGLLFNVTATTTHTVIALLAGTAGDWLRRREGAARWQRRFSGALLILLGVRVLVM